MEAFEDLTTDRLEEQIDLFKDRIETIVDYIIDADNDSTKSALQIQLQRYEVTLQNLQNERLNRSVKKEQIIKPKIEISNFLFDSNNYKIINKEKKFEKLINERIIVRIEDNYNDFDYNVALFNVDGSIIHSLNEIDLTFTKMMVKYTNDSITIMEKIAQKNTDSESSNFELTIFHKNGIFEKCILHIYQKNIDIEFNK